jgi:hypothetical protein
MRAITFAQYFYEKAFKTLKSSIFSIYLYSFTKVLDISD